MEMFYAFWFKQFKKFDPEPDLGTLIWMTGLQWFVVAYVIIDSIYHILWDQKLELYAGIVAFIVLYLINNYFYNRKLQKDELNPEVKLFNSPLLGKVFVILVSILMFTSVFWGQIVAEYLDSIINI